MLEVDVVEADDLPADAFWQRYVVRVGRAAVQRTAPCTARCLPDMPHACTELAASPSITVFGVCTLRGLRQATSLIACRRPRLTTCRSWC